MSTVKILNYTVLSCFLLNLAALPTLAAQGTSTQQEFDYPELMVTPRASDRLEMESSKERDRRCGEYLPLQVSALATFSAGVIQTKFKKSSNSTEQASHLAGLIVGGGWLVANSILAATQTPYASSWGEIKGLPAKTQREQLTRERMAEEALNSAASTARKVMWLSTLTNAGAGIFMAANARDFGVVSGLGAAALSLTPVIFRSYRIGIANEQREYKKKIYAPVAAGPTMVADARTGKVSSGLALSFEF